MIDKEDVINKGKNVMMNTYAQFPIVIEEGEGVYVKDIDGKEYLDFVAGIAVNCLGYKNKELIEGITKQLNKFTHCSNLYWNYPSIEAAELLVKLSGLNKVFFCNSGAEAVEGALKLSRKYTSEYIDNERFEIITMEKSFHGRTFGAVTATGQKKYQKGLNPLLPGIKYAKFNDFKSVKNLVTDKTCAIVVEPVQGEGGIRPANKSFLKNLRSLCNEKNIILIFDEVQCGIGRTGEIFAYQVYDVKPDIVCLAKGLGGGVSIGAVVADEKVAKGFKPGDHASTFGGNPLATTAAKIVLTELIENNITDNVKKQGEFLNNKLMDLKQKYDFIKDVRGIGLMQGIEIDIDVKEIISKCIDKGLLLIGAGVNVIRFVPPLIVSKKDIEKAVSVLDCVFSEV